MSAAISSQNVCAQKKTVSPLVGAETSRSLAPKICAAIQKVIAAKTYYAPTNRKVVLTDSEAKRCPCGGKIDQIRFFDPEMLSSVRPAWTERLNIEVVPNWKTR